MAALELKGIGRRFGERTALERVTFELPEGATLVIFGPNGAGKSTLLRILATLLSPTEGKARILGYELGNESWKLRGKIGLLGHEPMLYGALSARENLLYHARLHGQGTQRVQELLELITLTTRAEDPVRSLSRGMVQRVAVARSVLHKPQLLLLDEPRANLDPGAGALIEPLIGQGAGLTRVITSHDVSGGLKDADYVLGLRGGRPALIAAAAEVTEEAVHELYA